jgi:hypothetical protein
MCGTEKLMGFSLAISFFSQNTFLLKYVEQEESVGHKKVQRSSL